MSDIHHVRARHGCDECPRRAVVLLEVLRLCGDCFLQESIRRFQPSNYATASSTKTRSQPVRLRCS